LIYELMLRGGEPNSSPDGRWGRVARLIREVLGEGDPGTAYRRHLLTVLDEWAEPDTDIPAISSLPRLVCEANGGDPFLAAAVTAAWQLVRMAAKLFDDIEDGQLRGDLSEGINLATGLLFLASLALGDLPERAVSVDRVHALNQALNRAMLRACAGQHVDLSARRTGTTAIDPNDWLEIAWAKSGELLALASLGLIVWTGLAAWEPCRAAGGLSPAVGSAACPYLLMDLEPLLVALGFWAVGLGLWLAGQREPPVEFFLLTAGALAAGELSAMGSYPGGRLFYVGLAWLAPVTFHFHHSLLGRSPGRAGRIVLRGLYGLAAILSAPFVFWTMMALQQRAWFLPLRLGVRLSIALSMALAVLLLFRDYRGRASPAARGRIRLVTFGTVLAFTPLLLLSLLPDTLGAPAHVSYEFTFPWLLLSPLSYGYSFFRHRLVQAELALHRAAVYYLLVTLLLSLYLAAAAALNRFAADPAGGWPLAGALLGVGLLLLFAPLRQSMRRLVNWVWYGGEISYTRVVGRLAEALALALERETLRHLLVDELTSLMGLAGSALLLKEGEGELALVGATGFGPEGLALLHLPGDGRLAAYLEAVAEPVAGAQVRRALADVSLHPEERALLSRTEVAFWLPLVSGGALQGLLLIGPRPGGDFFTAEDERILATLAHQAGVAAHNVRLMEEVQAGREELARAHRGLLVGREREQRRLAHELHDSALQQLLGISYQLVESRRVASNGLAPGEKLAPALEASRQEILGVVGQLRRLIGELRPAGLKELGLSAALEGYAARLERKGGPGAPQIHLDLDGSGTGLEEAVAICLFRVAQEGLRNALRHAGAGHIYLSLHLPPSFSPDAEGEQEEGVTLSVCDDGCGFRVPERLSELARSDHFGLVGMAERVGWAGGQLTVNSQPGAGTEVRVWVPYGVKRKNVKRETSDVKRQT
jgi:two-component system sensor histidine kinase ComP